MYTRKLVLAGLIQGLVVSMAIAQSPPMTPVGTRAPDGIGLVVAPSRGAGPMTDGPWIPGSLMVPLQVGAKIPAGSTVRDIDGKVVDLNAAVASKPTVLIFYRGGWCPYCNAHLRDLQGSEPALRSLGYQILAISSDTPDDLRKTLTDDKLSYVLLSDAPLSVATKFGLRYKAKPEFLEYLRKNANTDLAERNGGYLLTPGAFVLDTAGVIRFAYVNTNFTVRVGQDALLKAARDAAATPAPAGDGR